MNITRRVLPGIIAATMTAAISGCASLTPMQMSNKVTNDVSTIIQNVTPAKKAYGLSYVANATEMPGTPFEDVDLNDDSGTVNISTSGPIGPVIKEYTKAIGYGITWAEGVSRRKPITISMSGISEKTAIRKLAVAAGYVAVFDHSSHTVTIANEATYVFHLPRHVMQTESASWSMSNDGSEGGGGRSSNSSSSLSGRARFTASGKSENAANSLIEYLASLAGPKAEISASQQAGHITVRGDGVAIERVRNYLQELTDNAMRQIMIDVAIIDIEIGSESSYGIDWQKTLSMLGGATNLAVTAAADVTNPNMSVSYSSGSIQSIVRMLRTKNDLKIITQPKISATNGVPTMIFDGQELPYLGEVTTATTDTVVNTGGTISYATDGVSLSAVADIASDTEAHLTLIPSIMNVREFTQFNIGATQATAPVRSTKEALISTTLKNGQTAVLGGIRYTTDTKSNKLLPVGDIPTSKDSKQSSREIAILLHAKISPKKHQSILFSESL